MSTVILESIYSPLLSLPTILKSLSLTSVAPKPENTCFLCIIVSPGKRTFECQQPLKSKWAVVGNDLSLTYKSTIINSQDDLDLLLLGHRCYESIKAID